MTGLKSMRLHPGRARIIVGAARAAFPAEACGLLIGHVAGPEAVIDSVLPAINVAADPRREFEIDPGLLLRTQRTLRNESGLQLNLIGVYHSHPNGIAEPSATDMKRWADWAGLIWLIAACRSAHSPVTLEAFSFSPQLPRNLAIIHG